MEGHRAESICSELHVFRGHQPSGTGFIMGHEFTGTITELGPSVKTLSKGDKIVSPFTLSCGECFYCKNDFSSRCQKGLLFGSAVLDGAQAEYVRIPLADSTVVKAPEGIKDTALVLMADIWPTGFFAASNGFKHFTKEQIADLTVVVIGCGPVGLCALINAEEYKPKHLLAIDSVPSRLELAKSLGAEPWNFQSDRVGLDKRVKELTDGRGADLVIEVVGLSPALKMGFELLRPWGVISSVGVHNGEVRPSFPPTLCIHNLSPSQLTHHNCRSLGQATKPTAKICASRWVAVPYAQYSLKPWKC